MRILFAGGGTAGHINPALAIAAFLRENQPDAEILFVGAKGGMEERLVPKAGFDFRGEKVSGFQRKLSLKNIQKNIVALERAFTASWDAKRLLSEFKPDLCVGTGGYVSGPVLRTAAKMGIPIIIHEQNAFPGVTTKMLSKLAKKVMLAVPASIKHFKDTSKCVIVGNPIRQEIFGMDKDVCRRELQLDGRPMILSFGGSLGAGHINKAVAGLIAKSQQDGKYQHIHGYGNKNEDFLDMLKEKGVEPDKGKGIDVRPYIEDMPRCLAAADVVIARAGAITLSEIEAMGKASILIPSPNVAENHQYHNAMALVNRNAAKMIEDKDLTEETLIRTVDALLSDKRRLALLEQNCRKLAFPDANDRIYRVILQVLGE